MLSLSVTAPTLRLGPVNTPTTAITVIPTSTRSAWNSIGAAHIMSIIHKPRIHAELERARDIATALLSVELVTNIKFSCTILA